MALAQSGHTVTKVNFNGGDRVYWRSHSGLKTTRTLACRVDEVALPAFYRDVLTDTGATDVVVFGDCRPVHQPAIALAKQAGLRVHVFEEGYFRPDWVTLERGGANGHSRLPADPNWYSQIAQDWTDKQKTTSPLVPVGASMVPRIWHDVRYNSANLLNPLFYPRYQSHVPHAITAEYAAYVARFARVQRRKRKDDAAIGRLTNGLLNPSANQSANPSKEGHLPRYFLVPLQIPGDAQLTFHSHYGETQTFIADVMRSFVDFAPDDALLVFKNHPLDPGLKRHDRLVARLARQWGCAERVRFLETGHLPTLLNHAAGLVAVNSTTIGQALFHRCPTIALGKSLFALPGLTFQGGLDAFWRQARQPDMGLFKAFHKVVLHTTQINGGFYNRHGISLCVAHALDRLLAPESPLERLLAEYPPKVSPP